MVYFAGEIVNPTSSHVVLLKHDAVVDSAKLDEKNRFAFNLKDIKGGIYHFDHSPQYQYVYLEEGDSLLIRLNASPEYFDESLVFSGTNGDINNFLIEMFLAFEDEESLINSYYELNPKAFGDKMDSLRQMKLDVLNDLKTESEFSQNAIATAQAAIDYNTYLYKEIYPFHHKKKTGEEAFHHADTTFYDYRQKIDLNNHDLTFFKPYYNFMKNHFGNLSYMMCSKNCGSEYIKKNDHLHYYKHKLSLVDSLVQEEELRNVLFRNIAMDFLLKEHMANEDCDRFINRFAKLSNNEKHKHEINNLYNGIQRLQPNSNLPTLDFVNTNGKTIPIKDIVANKETVFYFWSGGQKGHFKNTYKHIEKLKQRHPNKKFIGINLQTPHAKWVQLVKENNLDTLTQFRGGDFDKVQSSFIISNLNKCVIAKDTVIVDAFANLYASF
jgi:hypothetical protein